MFLELHFFSGGVDEVVDIGLVEGLFHLGFEVRVHFFKLTAFARKSFLDVRGIENILQVSPVLLTDQPIVDRLIGIQDVLVQFVHFFSSVFQITRPHDVVQIRQAFVDHCKQFFYFRNHIFIFTLLDK